MGTSRTMEATNLTRAGALMSLRRLVALVVATFVVVVAVEAQPVVQTPLGAIQGVAFDDSYAFLGIPYSNAPVDDMRWQPTQPVGPWDGVFMATQNKAGCPQLCGLPPLGCPAEQSEDCLGLNIYTPLGAQAGDNIPVSVFLPGGHFEQGTIGSILYTGRYIVNTTNTILVEVAYRLGALGWLRTTDGLSGHLGFQDQRLALQWIQANIASFGGDPTSVTLWGQSAGATSISAHLVSPQSKGLFSRVIMESNPWTLMLKDTKEAEDLGKDFLKDVSCDKESNFNDTLACLQKLDVDLILESQHKITSVINYLKPIRAFYPFNPVVDGVEVLGQPIDLIPAGNYNQVPILLGSVANESNIFIWQAYGKPVPEDLYIALITDVFKQHAPAVIERYPPHMYEMNDTRLSLSLVITHWVFTCPSRYIARAAATYNPDTYLYWFNHVWSFAIDGWGPNYTYCFDAVCHGSELPYVFHAGDFPGVYNFTSDENVLAASLVAYWGNYFTSGNPNQPETTVGYSGVNWPSYNQTTDLLASFQTTTPTASSISQGFDGSICDFWDTVGYDHWG